jgi:hypothetical protein
MTESTGTAGGEGSGPEPPRSELVGKLTGAGGEPTPTVVLRGLVGEGSQGGTWRLYLSQSFDEYVELAAADVVHSQAVDESAPLAGTLVWVRVGARLTYTQVSSREVQADFLQGGITARHLGRTRSASFGARTISETGYACTRNYVCSINPHIPACQLRTEVCGTLDCEPSGPFCPTGAFVVNC